MKLRVSLRPAVVIAVICAAGCPSLAEAGSTPIDITQPVNTTDECQDPLAVFKVDYLNGETGEYTDEPAAGSAKISHFQAQKGDDFQFISLPEGFDASSASDNTLANFAIPARPADQQDLTGWETAWGKVKTPETVPSMCRTGRKNADQTSLNWSGITADGHSDYRRVAGTLRVPHWETGCTPNTAGISIWVGLGGWGKDTALMQNGVSEYSNGHFQGANGWWEMLNSSYDTSETSLNYHFPERDLVVVDTYYNITLSRAEFRWQSTTNHYGLLVTVPSAGGQPASAFYHGATAEWIHERPTSTLGFLFQLQHYGVAGWADARASRAGQPAAYANQFPHNFVSMVSANGTLAAVAGHSISTTGDFSSRWVSCT